MFMRNVGFIGIRYEQFFYTGSTGLWRVDVYEFMLVVNHSMWQTGPFSLGSGA